MQQKLLEMVKIIVPIFIYFDKTLKNEAVMAKKNLDFYQFYK